MADSKNSFVVYTDIKETLDGLTDDQVATLFRGMVDYQITGSVPEFEGVLKFAFIPIRQQMDRDNTKWERTKAARTESGRQGGIRSGEVRRAKAQSEANEASASQSKQNEANEANEAVNVNVNVNVNGNGNVNGADAEALSSSLISYLNEKSGGKYKPTAAITDRIGELLDAPIDIQDPPDALPMPQIQGGIEFRDLTFRYPGGDRDVLQNISFRVEPGQSVGIVGKTGAGKTTLVDLLLHSYNIPQRKIFIDGTDINQIPLRDLRNGCAYVPQDNFLFSDTIENNIAFGQPLDDRVRQAACLADVDENIQGFPKNYQTILGERGVTVSGGQKQRISIARALIKDAPILILDDSVSAVDTKTEKTILTNLRATRQGKTTILIAHRISTVEDLDLLLYLEDGQLAAVGTHAQLLETCPGYSTMARLQKLTEEGGADNE